MYKNETKIEVYCFAIVFVLFGLVMLPAAANINGLLCGLFFIISGCAAAFALNLQWIKRKFLRV
jgi:uncharacterized oligopeptide transporter (OPT) family protein